MGEQDGGGNPWITEALDADPVAADLADANPWVTEALDADPVAADLAHS